MNTSTRSFTIRRRVALLLASAVAATAGLSAAALPAAAHHGADGPVSDRQFPDSWWPWKSETMQQTDRRWAQYF